MGDQEIGSWTNDSREYRRYISELLQNLEENMSSIFTSNSEANALEDILERFF